MTMLTFTTAEVEFERPIIIATHFLKIVIGHLS